MKNTISFRVLDIPEEEGQQVRIRVDGKDLLKQIQEDDIGIRLRSFINDPTLDVGGELTIGLCGLCHVRGCCDTIVNMIVDEDVVLWEGLPVFSPSVMLRLDRKQFEEAVREIRKEHSELLCSKEAERRVADEIDMSHLELHGLRFKEAFHIYWQWKFALVFHLEEAFDVYVVLPWDNRDVEELLDRCASLVSKSPDEWDDVEWKAKNLISRRPDELPSCVGPGWRWIQPDHHNECIPESKPECRRMIEELLSADSHSIQFDIVSSPVSACHQVRPVVNGIDVLVALGMGDLGIDPFRFFQQMALLEGGHFFISLCACGYENDNQWKVIVSDDQVVWQEQPESHLVRTLTLRFGRCQYEQAVWQAKNDHSWETPQRTAEGRISEEVDMSHLEQYGLQFEWVSCRFRKREAAVVHFRAGKVRVFLQVPWNLQDVDEAVERVKAQVALPPQQWADVFCLADSDCFDLPDCAGPGWKWDEGQRRYCPRWRGSSVDV